MRGWLVVSHFLNTAQFTSLYERFEEAAASLGVDLQRITNVEAAGVLETWEDASQRPDFVLFWDKDINLCTLIESYGVRAFNSSHAIAVCDDKASTYAALHRNQAIRQPRTLMVPKTYAPVAWGDTPFPDYVIEQLGLPVVVKDSCGSFGAQVRLARSRDQLVAELERSGQASAVVQEFVASSAGSDVRLQIVGGKFIGAMKRTSKTGDFRANVVNGGTAEPYEPPAHFIETACAVCAEIGLDFGGIDLLFGEDGESGAPIVCEANSNAHFKTVERMSGADVAGAILSYIKAEVGKAK